MMKKSNRNFLELIPSKNEKIEWDRDENDNVILRIENKGIFNSIAQKLFKKPKISNIHMDKMGSFIWIMIDGTRTVSELADMQKEKFGDKSEPLYPRIVKFFQIMESYSFIKFINKN